MHELCKVHKGRGASNDVPPFRPILTAIGTCTYNIATFFVPKLKDSTLNEYTARDSFSFVIKFKNKITIFVWCFFKLNHMLRILP